MDAIYTFQLGCTVFIHVIAWTWNLKIPFLQFITSMEKFEGPRDDNNGTPLEKKTAGRFPRGSGFYLY